ncbi:MAG: 3'(2'),5'-bisphosphate nucleotidase CysQ [Alphaproteobacteria bacterium]
MPDPSAELDLLITTARTAGALALQYYGKAQDQWQKDDNSPVSEADLAVDAHLKKTLLSARPDYGWLSEETEDNPERLTKPRVFVVDPIDGTRAFLKNDPHWGVSLALVENGHPIVAAFYNPALEELFIAEKDQGAFLNNTAISPSVQPTIEGARVLGHEGLYRHPSWPTKWPDELHIENRNSIAYTICLVAAGHFDGTVSLSGKSDWDLAAADLIMREAGGCLTTHRGAPYLYNTENTRHPNVVAAGPALHSELLEKLKEFDRAGR